MKPGTVLAFSGNGRGNVATVNVIPPVEPVRTWAVPKQAQANVK